MFLFYTVKLFKELKDYGHSTTVCCHHKLWQGGECVLNSKRELASEMRQLVIFT